LGFTSCDTVTFVPVPYKKYQEIFEEGLQKVLSLMPPELTLFKLSTFADF